MKIQARVNIRKAAVYSVIINGLQILAMIALGAYILIDGINEHLHGLLGDMIVITLCAVVCWGAAVDIKEAWIAMKMTVKLHGLDETVTQMTEMNHTLRAQRHDFLNHLQVVFSLIEMEEYQEANDYIEQVYGDIQNVSRSLKTACAPVNALLRAKIAEAEERKIRVELTVSAAWEELPLPAWEMCRVLSNLMDNAMDALDGQKDACLFITLQEDVKGFSFEIKNNGPAIPENMLSSIFEPGISGKGEGRGMGLYIARRTMQSVGGDLTVQSSEAFTAFSGYVPRPRPLPEKTA
ncbi:MAG: GHKL domain-containing protein [Clostridiales bacterium]|nr:GHKL domain-containing protein [Clostridiales bacterium]